MRQPGKKGAQDGDRVDVTRGITARLSSLAGVAARAASAAGEIVGERRVHRDSPRRRTLQEVCSRPPHPSGSDQDDTAHDSASTMDVAPREDRRGGAALPVHVSPRPVGARINRRGQRLDDGTRSQSLPSTSLVRRRAFAAPQRASRGRRSFSVAWCSAAASTSRRSSATSSTWRVVSSSEHNAPWAAAATSCDALVFIIELATTARAN